MHVCVHACVCIVHVCICMERGKVRKGEESYGRGGGRRGEGGEGGEEGRGGEEEWEQFLMNSMATNCSTIHFNRKHER